MSIRPEGNRQSAPGRTATSAHLADKAALREGAEPVAPLTCPAVASIASLTRSTRRNDTTGSYP